MLVIRMARGGKHKRPFYRIVVVDSRSPRDGRFIERLGHYNPIANNQGDHDLKLDLDRLTHWITRGAQPSDSVKRLIKLAKRNQAQQAA